MDADLIRRRVVVHGHVQGVFFRDSLRQRARSEHVSGWVSNRHDGAVEAVLEGSPEAVERLVAFANVGPRGARVDEIDVHEEQPESLSGFEVS